MKSKSLTIKLKGLEHFPAVLFTVLYKPVERYQVVLSCSAAALVFLFFEVLDSFGHSYYGIIRN